DAAAAQLGALGCDIVLASRGDDGALDLETRFIDVNTDNAGMTALARSALVERLEYKPVLALDNQNSVALAKANQVIGSPYNLNGSGEIAAVWDGGTVQLHTDFGGRVTNVDTSSVIQHATHVTGTILGSGAGNAQAKGFAPQATSFNYDYGGDIGAERRLR